MRLTVIRMEAHAIRDALNIERSDIRGELHFIHAGPGVHAKEDPALAMARLTRRRRDATPLPRGPGSS